LAVLRHRLTATTAGICAEPAAKNAQQVDTALTFTRTEAL